MVSFACPPPLPSVISQVNAYDLWYWKQLNVSVCNFGTCDSTNPESELKHFQSSRTCHMIKRKGIYNMNNQTLQSVV
jgi:hypothetical protein